MIVYVNFRLNQWAEWVARKSDGLGYPKAVAFARMAHSGSFGPSSPELCEDAWEVERCVACLDETLRSAVIEFYLKPGTCEQKARALRCCVRTLQNRIDRAQHEILGLLNDLAAGVLLPAQKAIHDRAA